MVPACVLCEKENKLRWLGAGEAVLASQVALDPSADSA
jgi:hypothetical protein